MNLSRNTILARDLVVDYATTEGTVRALDGCRLDVDGGASVAIMGPSGCGKSTLLGLLAGLATPTSGTVAIGSTVVSALGDTERVQFRRRAVGMVYQADNLLPFLTVEENVGLQLSIAHGTRRHHRGRNVAALLDRLGLTNYRTRLPDELSGGQRQRVAIARAIIHEPDVILADEPTGSLDDDNARRVLDLLLDASRHIGATLVLVTHDPGIGAHTDRIVHLRSQRRSELATHAG